MPQLEKLTFLSQFFWLCFFFLSFYIALLKFFLPQISQILKVRQKKIEGSQGSSSELKEQDIVLQKNETLFLTGIKKYKEFITGGFQSTTSWVSESVNALNQQALATMHKAFVSTVGQLSVTQNLSLRHLESLLPPSANMKLNINTLVYREKVFNIALIKALQK
jgi:hypothetical protein